MMTFAKKASPAISFTKTEKSGDTAVLLVFDDKNLSNSFKRFDERNGGIIEHHLEANPKFKGESGKTLLVTLPPKSLYLRVIILGLGKKSKTSEESLETAGGSLVATLNALGAKEASILNADDFGTDSRAHGIALLRGALLGSYHFDDYKTIEKNKKTPSVKKISVITSNGKVWEKEFGSTSALVQSVFLTRDLVNAPPNKLYPESFAGLIKKTLVPLGVKVQILDDKTLEKMGANCLLAVGQASEHRPRLVVMSWNGADTKKKSRPIALVGKGITFDSGGLNVKPFEGMMDMKMDMGGAATVVGVMHNLALHKSKVPVIAVVALAENAISDEATRPSDIVKSLSGKTVEILNTDAEGRLVLADALTYVQSKYNPSAIIDLATLTGAIMVALGVNYAGAFVNDEKLWKALEKSSSHTGEKLWRMPLDDSFRREMDSDFADIKNIGGGRFGGSCTAAAFLGEFIDEKRIWAHLDIAGTAMTKAKPTCPVPFASGYGVKLLSHLIEDHFE